MKNKFELVQQVIKKNSHLTNSNNKRLLDVGCRGCELKPYVEELVTYEGVDLFQNEEGSVAHILDVSKGLPFPDSSFDYVAALDIVEHLDDFKGALQELLRITAQTLLVMLPNMSHLHYRQRFLRTGQLSDKYNLFYGQAQDRHRWVTNLSQADKYMCQFAEDQNIDFQVIWFTQDIPKQRLLAKVGSIIGLSPDLWVWASLYVLTPKNTVSE